MRGPCECLSHCGALHMKYNIVTVALPDVYVYACDSYASLLLILYYSTIYLWCTFALSVDFVRSAEVILPHLFESVVVSSTNRGCFIGLRTFQWRVCMLRAGSCMHHNWHRDDKLLFYFTLVA